MTTFFVRDLLYNNVFTHAKMIQHCILVLNKTAYLCTNDLLNASNIFADINLYLAGPPVFIKYISNSKLNFEFHYG